MASEIVLAAQTRVVGKTVPCWHTVLKKEAEFAQRNGRGRSVRGPPWAAQLCSDDPAVVFAGFKSEMLQPNSCGNMASIGGGSCDAFSW